MRYVPLVLAVVACSAEPTAQTFRPPELAYSRRFCLVRAVVENQVPGQWRAVSEPDSLAGDCARWTFGSNTDSVLLSGDGRLDVASTVSVWAHVYDSTSAPPRAVDAWLSILRPGEDDFSFHRDSLDRLKFDGVAEAQAVNWWPFVGWWLEPSDSAANASYWHGDSLTTRLHLCYDEDCTDHLFVDATWRLMQSP
jgi:hypothetical protein